jgi:hypothetical protein
LVAIEPFRPDLHLVARVHDAECNMPDRALFTDDTLDEIICTELLPDLGRRLAAGHVRHRRPPREDAQAFGVDLPQRGDDLFVQGANQI